MARKLESDPARRGEARGSGLGRGGEERAFQAGLNAALARQAGPAAVAKAIERRLAGLERARGFVDWDKARSFREDLQALLDSIVKEIGLADPRPPVDFLLHEAYLAGLKKSHARKLDFWAAFEEAQAPRGRR